MQKENEARRHGDHRDIADKRLEATHQPSPALTPSPSPQMGRGAGGEGRNNRAVCVVSDRLSAI